MYKSTSFLFCLLVLLVGQCQAKPGLFDTIKDVAKSAVKKLTPEDCDDVKKKISWTGRECAMVFDEDDCSGDDDGLKIETGSTTFSTVGFLKNTDHKASSDYKDDIEGIIVKKGCQLTAYKKSGCTGGHETYPPKVSDEDTVFDNLDDEFDEEIECVKCCCGAGC